MGTYTNQIDYILQVIYLFTFKFLKLKINFKIPMKITQYIDLSFSLDFITLKSGIEQ